MSMPCQILRGKQFSEESVKHRSPRAEQNLYLDLVVDRYIAGSARGLVDYWDVMKTHKLNRTSGPVIVFFGNHPDHCSNDDNKYNGRDCDNDTVACTSEERAGVSRLQRAK